jgi:hypothetical protein
MWIASLNGTLQGELIAQIDRLVKANPVKCEKCSILREIVVGSFIHRWNKVSTPGNCAVPFQATDQVPFFSPELQADGKTSEKSGHTGLANRIDSRRRIGYIRNMPVDRN